MPTDLKQSQLSEANTSIGQYHYLTGYVGTANFKISWTNIQKAILGTAGGILRTIAQNIDGSIVTTDASQNISNKDLLSPKINGGAVLSVTSTILNYLSGLTSNLQNQLNSIIGRIATNERNISAIQNDPNKEILFSVQATPTNAVYYFNSDYSGFDGNDINPFSVMCKLYKYSITGVLTEMPTDGLQVYYENSIMTSIAFPIPEVSRTYRFVIKCNKVEIVTPNT